MRRTVQPYRFAAVKVPSLRCALPCFELCMTHQITQRMQQLQYIVMAVAILAIYAKVLAAKPYYKKELPELLCWVTTIECAAFAVMLEYAIAYWVLPAAVDYVIMAMALCGIFLSVRLIVRRALRNEDVPWKDR